MRIYCLRLGLFLLLALTGCGQTPQIGTDPSVFKAVDALYTAVSMRESTLLDRCNQTLQQLKTEGKLSERAWKSLGEIEDLARAGQWKVAQTQLADFMRGQRPR